jgi:quinol monooxygenase YgiN
MGDDPMLLAHVHFTVDPARRASALAALLAEAEAVRGMPGNVMFVPFADPTDPSALRVIHEWQTAATFEGYLASSTFAAVGAVLRPMMTAPPVSHRFDATLRQAAA